jgi:hypothetical protein
MTIPDQLTANFHRWEQRGRGVELFPAVVSLEPPFVAFTGHRVKVGRQSVEGRSDSKDSGAKPTFLSQLVGKVLGALQAQEDAALAVGTAEEPCHSGLSLFNS